MNALSDQWTEIPMQTFCLKIKHPLFQITDTFSSRVIVGAKLKPIRRIVACQKTVCNSSSWFKNANFSYGNIFRSG